MWSGFFGWIRHRLLRRPYRLTVSINQGEGTPVVLMHGIGRSGDAWLPLAEKLAGRPYHLIAFDLLGFGNSPKPDVEYTVDDHAQAVIAAIDRLHLHAPAILVGHSMGCLIAVRVARLRPDLVRHLVLYEMPLYEGLPQTRRYKMLLDFYFRLYERIIAFQPDFTRANTRLLERVSRWLEGPEVRKESWRPFVLSLKNTIMRQSAAEDIKQLTLPMDLVYGSFDMLVIRGKTERIFGTAVSNISAHTIRERHTLTRKSAEFLAARIEAAAGEHRLGVQAAESKNAHNADTANIKG